MLISEVLRILDRQEAPRQEELARAAEPFSALLTSTGAAGTEITRARDESIGPESPFSPRGRAEPFPVERRSFDDFLRALEESAKLRSSHALDLFQ